MQEFKNVLLMMTSGSELNSLSTGNLLAPLLESLYEQLLALQVQNDYLSDAGTSPDFFTGPANSLGAANLTHINQFEAERQVGGNGANANCGPTSLVMALHQLGLGVAGETASTSSGEAVDLARLSMVTSSAKDGVDASGRRVDAEHNSYTNFSELARGATEAGARSERIDPDASSIIRALQRGASVIVSGTFAGKYPLPWTGDRGSDNQSAPGNATAHIIKVGAYDPSTQLFTINDPARLKPHQVTAAALERFMSGNAGALAVRR